MLATPNRFATGVTTTVRFVPVPVMTKLLTGTNEVSDDPGARPRLAAGVSTSCTEKGSAAVAVFSSIVWSGIADTSGKSFTSDTVNRKIRVTTNGPPGPPPSVAVTV